MQDEAQQAQAMKLIRLLACTLIISVMSAGMFNVVLPQIREQFHLTLSQVSWMTSVYTLIYAIGTVIYGKLADKYKLKQLLTVGLFIFAAGSVLGICSTTFGMVIFGRALQAAGAAVIPATATLIPVRYFPVEKRGTALGMSAVGLAIGNALSPVVSALVSSVADWRWLFCIPLLTLLLLPWYRKFLNDEPGAAGQVDWPGAVLLGAGVGMLLFGLSEDSWLLMAGGAAAFILFGLRIGLAKEPFIQPKLLKNKSYMVYLAATFLITGISYSLIFLSPLLLAGEQRLSSGWIGLALVPAALCSALLGKKGGTLADTKGVSFVFHIASVMLLSCFALMSVFTGASPVAIAFILVLGNVGQSFMNIVLASSASKTLPKSQTGIGMGMFSMMNFISGSVAVAINGKIIDMGASGAWNPLNFSTGGAYVYSNIFLVLGAVHVVLLIAGHWYLKKGSLPGIKPAGASAQPQGKA
ncbi:MFS transporter [Paenibacillus sp. VCA1]|uniref:MFS transporter n=1 Tax=Paenibacillus sp. VCA1 TaxID=3039148 RepID=UPI0028729BA6|nr:MFS transporter [Paenibacillus sp. VCA1]MDR9856279.1 MFS transporter [Paenibacillus sp. VCA1]